MRPVDIAIRAALGIIRVAAILLYRIRLHRLVMWMNRRRPRVLLYHACEPDESPFIRGLRSNTHPVTFAAQLAFLVRHGYCVIPVERLANGPIPERAVAITFDDGYRSVFTAAYPLLRGQGLPATVYLVSDVVDNDRLVWVNELNWFLHAHAEIAGPMIRRALGLSADVGHEAIIATAHERYDRDLIAVALATLRAATGTDPVRLARDACLYVSWTEVAEMAAGGITFGNHTATHPNLARLPVAEQQAEILRGRDAVIDRLGGCDSLAYPFGHHDDASRRAAVALGHRTVMEVGGINAPLDPTRTARFVIAATSDAEFFAEVEVLGPLRGRLRRLASRSLNKNPY